MNDQTSPVESHDALPEWLARFGVPELPELPESRPAGDQRALLQRVSDLRRERDEAAGQLAHAADDIWLRVADLITELQRHLSREDGSEAGAGEAVGRSISAFCDGNQLELVAADGEDVNTLEPGQFEVMSLAPVTDSAEHNRVQETFQPLIRHRGRVLRPGRVIVGKYE